MTEVTRILSEIERGDPQAAAQLLPVVYDELRRLAAAQMAREKPGQTLDATGLVHEAFLRLVGEQRFENRRHFFAAAAEAMRRILVESARRRASLKRGGGLERVSLEDILSQAASSPWGESGGVKGAEAMLALDDALERLSQLAPERAELVKLRFFAGMTMPEAAAALDISLATAERWWLFARSWLYAALAGEKEPAAE